MPEQTPEQKSGLSESELSALMEASNSIMDATIEIVAPGKTQMTVSELAMAALACKAAGQRFEQIVMEETVDKSTVT